MLGNQSVVTDATVDWQTPPVAGFAPGGGQLGALKTLSGTTIPGYLTQLDAVAKTLHDDVNAAYGVVLLHGHHRRHARHRHPRRLGDHRRLRRLAASGANDLATAVAALRDRAPATAQYGALVRQVGSDADNATRAQSVAQAASDAAEDRRQNVSGVSLDEEMANMLRFQRGYQASARAMSTIDDMLDTLINRAGRVGL